MDRIKPGMIVEMLGRRGVTVPDFMSSCHARETPVVWHGETAFIGVQTDNLTIIGSENAKADVAKCGAGKGAECCIFMTVGPDGFCCERHTDLRYALIFKIEDMNAKRLPTEPYPACQAFDAAGAPADPYCPFCKKRHPGGDTCMGHHP